jgi:hypothetical protein
MGDAAIDEKQPKLFTRDFAALLVANVCSWVPRWTATDAATT